MSALIRQSHANNESPLWASASSGGGASATEYNLVTTSGQPANTKMTSDNTTNGVMVLQGDNIRFGKVGSTLVNTGLTTSAFGANLDVFNVGGVITTFGTPNSAGLIMNNAQHISILDGGAPTQNETLRIESGTTPAPGSMPYANILSGSATSDGVINFGIIGGVPAPQSSLVVSTAANGDSLNIGGGAYVTGGLQCGTLSFVLDPNPANAIYGTATLVNGLATVSTNQCDITSIILLTRTDVNASIFLGELRIRQKNANSFVVESTNPSSPVNVQVDDQSTFDWIIINPTI